jgi:hypothetical protein
MIELYFHSPVRLHGVVLNEAQGPLYLYILGLPSSFFSSYFPATSYMHSTCPARLINLDFTILMFGAEYKLCRSPLYGSPQPVTSL